MGYGTGFLEFKFEAAKGQFFDRQKIITALGIANVRILSKFGAFVRRMARTSLRYRKKSAPAGSPPSAHRTAYTDKVNKKTGKKIAVSLLREFLFFSYDSDRKSVVIGPAIIGGVRGRLKIPHVLEFGGDSLVLNERNILGKKVKPRPIHVEPHPYMTPAMKAELPKFPGLYANSVHA